MQTVRGMGAGAFTASELVPTAPGGAPATLVLEHAA